MPLRGSHLVQLDTCEQSQTVISFWCKLKHLAFTCIMLWHLYCLIVTGSPCHWSTVDQLVGMIVCNENLRWEFWTIRVAPDHFCLQWCLSGRVLLGCARSLSWGFPRFGREGMRGHVFGELALGFCKKQTFFWIHEHNGNKIDLLSVLYFVGV